MPSTAKAGSGWAKRFAPWLKGEPDEEGETRGFCPIHEDPETSKTPSASFNFSKGKFMCFGGCGGMSLSSLWSITREDLGAAAPPESKVRSIASSKSARAARDLPSEKELQKWKDDLFSQKSLLDKLTEGRGLSLRVIEQFEIGYSLSQKRYTLPVRDRQGELINIRLYKPDATKVQDKMRNWRGHGQASLYGVDALEAGAEVFLVEGEMDMLIGRSYGFNTMTHTSGAGSWQTRWSPALEGKVVYVIYDNDDTGRSGARRTSTSVRKYAESTYIIPLPVPNKGDDLTDYFLKQGHNADDLRVLVEDLKATTQSRAPRSMDGVPTKVNLEQSMAAEFTDTPISFTATIAGKKQPSLLMPKKVHFECDKSWGEKCKGCSMYDVNGSMDREVKPTDDMLLGLIDKSKEVRRKEIKKHFRVMENCPKVDLEEDQQWSVEELVLIPSVDDRGEEAQTPINRVVYNVGAHATPVNTTASFLGFNTTDPRNGRAVLQSWDCEETQTNLDKFEMNVETLDALKVFRPKKKESPLQRMERIAEDIEANVTRIYGRPELHMAYDLVWHSVMSFRFKSVLQEKGWLELLVMGDTRTGKSEAALRLTEHYQAGILKSCEGATLAGLVGGAQQMGNSWMVTWGTIPLQDRRLVVLDEVSGIGDKGIIEQMSAVRSSGRAQITKIVSQETSARTRLIWISNPPDGRAINEMNRGAIDAVEGLVTNPEDIARFDIAMSAASSDVDPELINSINPPKVKHKYTKELCSLLVSWVWSRKADDIWWEDGVEDYVLQRAKDFGSKYIPEPPLVQTENVRVKLARVSVAVAARLFSTDASGEKVLVGREHVDAAVHVLHRLYGMPSFGYLDYSTKEIHARQQAEKNRKNCRKFLVHNEDVLTTLKFVINDTQFRGRDFEDFGGMVRDEAQVAVLELMKMRMVKRLSKGYMKMQPELISLVKQLEAELDDA